MNRQFTGRVKRSLPKKLTDKAETAHAITAVKECDATMLHQGTGVGYHHCITKVRQHHPQNTDSGI